MRQTSNKNLPGSTGSNKWIQNDRNKYMVGLNHQQCKTIFTERFRLSPSSEFTGKKNQNFNISTGKSRQYKINMKMFLKLLFKFTLNDLRN